MIAATRVALRLAAMLAWLALCLPLSLLHRVLGRADPWPPRFLGGIARIAGVRIRTAGTPCGAPEHHTLILANHVSWIDIPALAATSGAAFIAHDGLAGVPLVRFLCRLNHTTFIARGHRASVAAQIADVAAAIARRHVTALFPEGTTSDGATLLPFKSALLAALDPLPPRTMVQPVWLDYGPDTPNLAWIGDEPGLANFIRILARRQALTVTVHYLPELAGPALTSRKTITAAARMALLAAMAAGDGA